MNEITAALNERELIELVGVDCHNRMVFFFLSYFFYSLSLNILIVETLNVTSVIIVRFFLLLFILKYFNRRNSQCYKCHNSKVFSSTLYPRYFLFHFGAATYIQGKISMLTQPLLKIYFIQITTTKMYRRKALFTL